MRDKNSGRSPLLGVVLLGLVALTIVALKPRWGELPYYETDDARRFEAPFRTMAEHNELMKGRDWPYVLDLRPSSSGAGATPGPALLYFGSRHTQDPDDPQVTSMRELWDGFEPTVAVTENRLGPYFGALGDGVGVHGEFALASELGRRDGLPVYTLEPPWSVEVEMLKREFSIEEAIVFYTLRVYLSERDETAAEKRDALAEHLLEKRAGRPGLGREHVPDLARFDEVWVERFPGLGDWRTLPGHAVSPSDDPTRLQRIATRANQVRDDHAAAVILDLLEKGERVFAIAGGSHVVKQEPVIRAWFD